MLISGLAVSVFLMAAVTVYFFSFTGFADWDDEGYVMIGLRSFLLGNALYDHVYSQYGPFYYLVQAGLYTVLHLEVTHNAVRALTGLFWILSSVSCSWSVYRLTRSWTLTAVGFTAAIRLLVFFTGSPGHPEELCLALLIGVLVSASYLSDGGAVWAGCLLGSLLAALTLTKINIGVYAALAAGLALLKAMPSGPKQKAAFAFVSVAGLCLPVIVLAPLLHFGWAQRTVVLVILSMSAAILVAWHSETDHFATRSLWIACVTALGVVAALVVTLFLSRGTTLAAMLYMSVLQYKGFAENWYIPFPVRTELVPAASLLLAIAWATMSGTSWARRPMVVALNILKVVVSLVWFYYLPTDRWPLMYNFAIPAAWLVLVPPTADAPKKLPFTRLALCLLSVFAALYLLPVAGAQMAFSVVLTIPILCLFLDDARTMLVTVMRLRKVVRIIEVAAVVLLVTVNAYWARKAVQNYRRLTPLSFAGAERIHVGARAAATYQWMTDTLKNSCDSSFSMPGIFSLYFWTNTTPPTNLLMSNWIGLLNADQQQQVVNDLSRFQKLCIVYNPQLVSLWRRGQDLSASPLARYIQDGFSPYAHRDEWVILVRNDHTPP
jgi:hypothetical protein